MAKHIVCEPSSVGQATCISRVVSQIKEKQMNKPSQGQVLSAIAMLMCNADWGAVSPSVLQKVIDDPLGSGREFTAFLKNSGRVIVDEPNIIRIDRTTAFDPVAFLGADWSIVEQDGRSLELAEVDPTKVRLETMLKKGETSVGGEEKLKRLIASGNIRLDAKIFQAFWENQHLIPEHWKQPTNGNTTFIFFDGEVLRSPIGNRCVPYLYWLDGEWRRNAKWLGNDWDVRTPSAVLAS